MILAEVDIFGAVIFFGRQLLVIVAIYFVIIFLLRMSGYYRLKGCPECGNDLKRSQRTLLDKLLTRFSVGILPLKRYRCYSCYWEGAAFEIKKGKTQRSFDDKGPDEDSDPETKESRSELTA